jgi:hypothetical protein
MYDGDCDSSFPAAITLSKPHSASPELTLGEGDEGFHIQISDPHALRALLCLTLSLLAAAIYYPIHHFRFFMRSPPILSLWKKPFNRHFFPFVPFQPSLSSFSPFILFLIVPPPPNPAG